jgi:nicotinamide-nucleotide amidase
MRAKATGREAVTEPPRLCRVGGVRPFFGTLGEPKEVYTLPMINELSELVARVARWALGAKYRIVTAESCTGGWIAKVFTDAAGSSRWFECGYVTYSNEAKARDLGVSWRTLNEHGAVSEATVREMAAGALRATGADVSIAVSGIAGPDGGSAEKPVGTVWFCVGRRVVGDSGARRDATPASDADVTVTGERGADVGARSGAGAAARVGVGAGAGPTAAAGPDIELLAEGQLFGGDREAVRRASVQRALELVLQFERHV